MVVAPKGVVAAGGCCVAIVGKVCAGSMCLTAVAKSMIPDPKMQQMYGVLEKKVQVRQGWKWTKWAGVYRLLYLRPGGGREV